MGVLVKSGAALAMLAMGVAAVPADAQWGGGRRHRGGDRIDGGDVLLGALLAGGLIAVLSSANKRQTPPPPPPPEPVYDRTYVPPIVEGRAGERTGSDRPMADRYQDAAVDACVAAAEQEGRRFARVSRIDAVSAVDPDGRGWYVRGTLSLRDDYRDTRSDRKSFRCRIGDRGVEDVTFDGERVAIN